AGSSPSGGRTRTPRAWPSPPSGTSSTRSDARYHRPMPDQRRDSANDDVPAVSPRYDRLAEGYAAHWGPVIRPAAEAVLDLIEVADGSRGPRIVDIGSGTGTL